MNSYIEKIIKDNKFNFEVIFNKHSIKYVTYIGHKDDIYCLIYRNDESSLIMYFKKIDNDRYVPINQDGYFSKTFYGGHIMYRYRLINSSIEGEYLEFIEYYNHGTIRTLEYYEIVKPMTFKKVKDLSIYELKETYKVFKNPRPNSIFFKFNKKFNEFFFNKKGKLHRLNGPAEYSYNRNGKICAENYYKNGVFYRKNGPATIYYDFYGNVESKIYYKNGEKSRQVNYYSGRVNEILIYNKGVIDREKYPANYYLKIENGKIKRADIRWYSNGEISNHNGAARILITENKTKKEYYIDGNPVKNELQIAVMKKIGNKYERKLVSRIRKLIKKENEVSNEVI